MKRKFKNQKGFTIAELLLFMGIFSILTVVLLQLLTSIFDVQLESQSTSSVSQDGRYILNRLGYDIQKATTIVIPNIGNQDQTLQLASGGIVYTYSLANGNLTITSSPSGTTDQLNSFNTTVSDINFLRLADINNKNDTVSFSFTLTSKAIKRSGAVVENFRTTVGIR